MTDYQQDARIVLQAIKDDEVEPVRNAVQNGLSPHHQMGMMSLLTVAAENGSYEVAKYLLDAGADVNFGGRGGKFPLMAATKAYGAMDVLHLLLKAHANVGYKYLNGNTPLLEATRNRDYEKVEVLIQAGSDLLATNNGGDTGLHIAVLHGNPQLVKLYLDHGVKVDAVKYDGPKKARSTGVQPLHLTAYTPNCGNATVAHMLLEAGADVDAEMTNKRTTLHIAAMRNAVNVADVLLSWGCALDPLSVENDEHKSPLMHAVDGRHLEMVAKLASAGADLNTVDIWGLTPLMTAAFHGMEEIARYLIIAGCDLDTRSKNGMTPFKASLRNNPNISLMLLYAGCLIPWLLRDTVLGGASLPLHSHRDSLAIVVEYFTHARPLQELCRSAIRRRLGVTPQGKIQKLPVPQKVQKYIGLSDITEL